MATYKKPSITPLFQTLNGTENAKGGSAALEQFKAHKTITIKEPSGIVTLIPFHAVQTVTTEISSADETKADPYCE